MAKIPIALELYSVREELAKDPRGTLKRVAEMGYEGVEFAGFPLPAEELRGIIDEVGLICCSSHTPLEHLLAPKIEETIAVNRTLGNRMLICPWISGEYAGSAEGWRRGAQLFNSIAAQLAPHGMLTGYHNHHIEFQPLENGETPWDIFFSNTNKEVVMQLDTGNALHGGGLSVPILEQFPGRAVSLHLKPYSRSEAAKGENRGYDPLIGDDEIPWDRVFELAETTGATEWYVVEYESSAYPALEAVDRCLKALRKMGK